MPVAMIDDAAGTPQIYFIHADHLDRPAMMTDASKAVSYDAVFRPFGELQALPVNAATINLRFPGQYQLSETGLAHNWHRQYDASIGRYIQPDPLGFVDGPSVYAYARSSPGMEVDTSGTFTGVASLILRALDKAHDRLGSCENDRSSKNTQSAEMPGLFLLVAMNDATRKMMFGDKSFMLEGGGGGGRLGGAAHRAKVYERAGQLENEGYVIEGGGGRLPERSVITPEGQRRFPDISARDPSGNPYYENIGRSTSSGGPVARERRALEDIGRSTGTTPGFTPYDR
jgi:RHS repeat-associated protein